MHQLLRPAVNPTIISWAGKTAHSTGGGGACERVVMKDAISNVDTADCVSVHLERVWITNGQQKNATLICACVFQVSIITSRGLYLYSLRPRPVPFLPYAS